MVGHNPVSAVLISADLDSCRDFYENKLGLELSPRTIKNHLLFECGDGTTLLIYFRPGDNNADHTQVRFWTQDIEADVAELEATRRCIRGVRHRVHQDGRPHRNHPGHRSLRLVQGSCRENDRVVSAGVGPAGPPLFVQSGTLRVSRFRHPHRQGGCGRRR